jgi:two-component system chemotaxis response regulator CheB
MVRGPTWIGAESGEVVEIRLAAADILLLLVGPPHSRAILLDRALRQEIKRNTRALVEMMSQSGISDRSGYQFRLFGNPDEMSYLQAALTAMGWVGGKNVALSAPTSEFHFIPLEGRLRIKVPLSVPAENPTRSSSKIRVLIVDDSETIRKLLTHIFEQDPELECVGAIANPNLVLAAIPELKPDVITLDIHMPEMDGVTLLKQILARYTIPAVMITSVSREDGSAVLDALEAGAVDYIQKPSMQDTKLLAPMICEKIKMARHAKVDAQKKQPIYAGRYSSPLDVSYLIAIGSSTGGTEALKQILTQLPGEIPPVLIAQHIPGGFSKAFADRINGLCPFEVKEANNGDLVGPGKVFVAPGGTQMTVVRQSGELRIRIDESPTTLRYKPSVDVLFASVAQLKIKKIVGIILTGMGADGAEGLLGLRREGAVTLAQDESTSIVFGMPKEAIRRGAAQEILPLPEIAGAIRRICAKKS